MEYIKLWGCVRVNPDNAMKLIKGDHIASIQSTEFVDGGIKIQIVEGLLLLHGEGWIEYWKAGSLQDIVVNVFRLVSGESEVNYIRYGKRICTMEIRKC